jgi:hypothetical protein
VRLAFMGAHGSEWMTAVYAGHEPDLRRAANWARLILLFHSAVIAVSIVFRLWPLPLIVTFAPFIANWWKYIVFYSDAYGIEGQR